MQFDRIVIAVDFSAASLAAARWVAMQLAPRAELALVHVVGEPVVPSFLRPHLPSVADASAKLTPALHGALRGLAGVVGSERTSVHLLIGTPADALAAFARSFGADLICLGRRRRRRGAARFGDTTAQRLLAQTRIPVLVVPMPRPTLPARILAAIDDQPDRADNLRVAVSTAQSYEATLDLLHVLAPELPGLAASALGGQARLEALARGWLASQVERVGEEAHRVTSHVRFGDPGEQIVRFAQSAGADLVLVGRGTVERKHATLPGVGDTEGAFRLGSTARLVLWASPSPVLVLPPVAKAVSAEPPRRSDVRGLHLGTTSARRTSATSPHAGTVGPDDYPPAARHPRTTHPRRPTSAA